MSGVSYDVLSQFAKLVNKDKKANVETTVYGTIVEDGAGNKYVKLDGTDQLTPFSVMPSTDSTSVAVDVDDRVSVSIKNHTATVTGNMSSPAAKNSDVQEIKQFDILIADRVQAVEAVVGDLEVGDLEAVHAVIGDLEAAKAKITELEASNATITGKLTATEADIENLEATKIDASIVDAQYANITGQLTAVNANISNLETQKASVEDLKATNANITNLEAANATITGNLTAAQADIDNLEANKASIKDLNATNANVQKLTAEKADIDFANVKTLEGVVAIIEDLLKAGHIITDDLDAVDGNFTNYLTGVRIVGDIIEGNTIKAKSLILVDDENGLYYQLNANSLGIDTVKLDKEKYSNALDGSAIVEKSITAQKITVQDLVAFGAKIADFTMTASDSKSGTPGAIYSGTKSGVNEDNSRGIYLDSHGQFAVGDSDNFVKFYKDTDGSHKLAIQAQKITFGSGKKNVETAINEANVAINNAQNTANTVQSNLDNLKVGGINYLLNSKDEQFNNAASRAEYLKTTFDLAPFFDENGLVEVTLSFDAYAPVAGNVQVYCQNGSGSRYSFTKFVNVTTDWQRYSVTFTPTGPNEDFVESYLAFYGTYDSGVIPHVRKLKLETGNKATDWSPAPEDVDASINDAQDAANGAQNTANAAQSSADSAQTTADAAQKTADDNALEIDYLNVLVQKVQDSLKTFVIDENGTTLLDQTGTGWQFNFSDLSGSLDDLNKNMESALEHRGYITFEKNDGNPYIIIAASQTGLKLKLTASSIEFLDASDKSLVDILSSDEDGDVGLTTDKINVVEELTHDDFVWKVRKNGNFGLSWKG